MGGVSSLSGELFVIIYFLVLSGIEAPLVKINVLPSNNVLPRKKILNISYLTYQGSIILFD